MVFFAATVVLSAVSSEAGGAGACADVRVEMQRDLGQEWSDAVRELRDELSRLARGDCERVALAVRRERGSVRIVAFGADGRRAERALDRPSALVPTALGLILSIPPEPPSDAHVFSAEPSRQTPVRDRTPTAPSPAISPHASAWLGVGVGVRLGQPASVVMADVEGRADLVLNRWLLLASFRYAPVGIIRGLRLDVDTYHEIAVGLGVGRRIDVGRVPFDFALAPTLVAAKMEGDTKPGDNDADDVRQSDVQLRIDASVRCLLPIAKSWRLTLTTDAEVAPADLGAPVRLDPRLPPFPSWTAGLRLGATGELL
jgi:hypothetical protein